MKHIVGEGDELLAGRHHRDHENQDMKQAPIRRREQNQGVVHARKIMTLGALLWPAYVIVCQVHI